MGRRPIPGWPKPCPERSEDLSGFRGISHSFPWLSPALGYVTYVLLTRAPLYSPSEESFLDRLACVKPAASVRSEPGSNSPSCEKFGPSLYGTNSVRTSAVQFSRTDPGSGRGSIAPPLLPCQALLHRKGAGYVCARPGPLSGAPVSSRGRIGGPPDCVNHAARQLGVFFSSPSTC